MSIAISAMVAVILSAPPQLISSSSQEVLRPQIHAKGTEIAWETQAQGNRIVKRYSLSRKKLLDLTIGEQTARDFSWTKKAAQSLYNVLVSQGRWALWVKNREPSAASAASDLHGALSPDGKHIAFISGRTGQGDVYIVKAHKTNQSPRRLTTSADPELYPKWSPDGKTIALIRVGLRGRQLVVLKGLKAGTGITETIVADGGDNPISANWSPDSKQLAFYGREWGVGSSLYVTNVSGGGAREVLSDVLPQRSGPAWSRNAKGEPVILVVQNNDEVAAVHPDKGTTTLKTGTFGNAEIATGMFRNKRIIAITALGRTAKEHANVRYRKLYLWTWQ